MKAERLKKVEEIYHAALEIQPTDRKSFLVESCGEDIELLREVESLLSFNRTSDAILNSPPGALAAEMFTNKDMYGDLIGKEIRHYKIIELLGRGGMGEVYLAEDTKLRRKIALKLLPPQFSTDPERKKRFVKEAWAISALNHPNIITIYEIEETENIQYIATEFVDGKTLSELLAEKSLDWEDAVRIAIQITSALESAHTVGVIHRDIKPANIVIRKDGLVKILDFGLAKLTAATSGDSITRELTAPHRIMGTINYMSPEQALGEKIDSRTDIFSFGVVLHEMLFGKVPFQDGEDAANERSEETGSAFGARDKEIPPALNQIVKHSLEKDRSVRYQTVSEFHNDLKKLLSDPNTASFDYAFTDETALQTDIITTPATKSSIEFIPKTRISPTWLIAALAVLVLAFGVYWIYFSEPQNLPSNTPNFQSATLDVLTAHGLTQSAAISPDGKLIAYAKKNEDGRHSLFLRQTSSVGDTEIIPPNKTKYSYLKFSRDGEFIYFVGKVSEDQPSSLFKITTLGRNQQKIVSDVNSQIDFSPDGKNIAFVRVLEGEFSIVIIDREGKNERTLITRKVPKAYTDTVSWSPDGKLIASPTMVFGADYAAGIGVIDVETGEEKLIPLKAEKLLRISKAAWLNDGKGLIFSLLAAPMGARYQLRYAAYPSGEVENVTNDLTSYEDFSLTTDSNTLVAVQREYTMGLWVTTEDDFETAVGIESKTGADDGEHGVAWTDDGKVIYVSSEGGAQNIWKIDADGKNPKPLTTGYKIGQSHMTLANDTGMLTYLQVVSPGFSFFQMDTEGKGVRRVVKGNDATIDRAHANEDWIVYTSRADGKLRIWKEPLAGGERVQLTNIETSSPRISPDNKSVAYLIREKGKPLRIGISSIEGGEPLKTFEIPPTTNTKPGLAWNKTGDEIFFVNTLGTTSNIWSQPLGGSEPKPITDFKEFQIANFSLYPEGNRLAISRGSRNRDVVLVENLRY